MFLNIIIIVKWLLILFHGNVDIDIRQKGAKNDTDGLQIAKGIMYERSKVYSEKEVLQKKFKLSVKKYRKKPKN